LPYRAILLLFVLLAACSPVRPVSTSDGQPAISKGVSGASPTVVSEDLLALAVDQRISGEYEDARATLERVLAAQPDAERERAARYEQARLQLAQGQADAALATLEPLSRGDDIVAARALFLIGRAHESAGRHDQAIDAFGRYRRLETAVEPYAALREAAQQLAAGRNREALALYTAAAQQPLARGRRVEVLEKLVELQPDDAGRRLDALRELLTLAEEPAYRAELLWRAVQQAPDTDEARGWLDELVRQYAATPQALEALATLDAVAPLDAAGVYFAHERWAEAVPLYDAALAGELSDEQRFEGRRKRALALRAQALYPEALAELRELAQLRPAVSITATAQAELDYIQTVGWQGDTAWAIDGYRRFAQRFGEHELAPEALWRAIQLQRRSDVQAAIAAALELGRAYPQSVQAHIALTDAGLHYWTTGERERAISAWKLLGDGANGTDSAEGNFWAGKALVQTGRGGEAGARLQAAAQSSPQSYYGARALELLNQFADGAAPLGSGPSAQERAAAAAWIDTWAGAAPSDAVLPELERAAELWALGLTDEARDEWLSAASVAGHAHRLWDVAVHAYDTGDPYIALKSAERLIEQSPDQHITAATPIGVLRLLYPTPFARVIQREADAFGIDPRLLYALLRQESLFRPDATSWAGARGLGQIMPATGQGIAQRLGMAGYTDDLLYRPAISIRFAAHYLSAQLRTFDNNVLAAASAYNGGPGNAARWLENSSDRDLFAELIDYRETRDYVKIVYGNWATYRRLYQR